MHASFSSVTMPATAILQSLVTQEPKTWEKEENRIQVRGLMTHKPLHGQISASMSIQVEKKTRRMYCSFVYINLVSVLDRPTTAFGVSDSYCQKHEGHNLIGNLHFYVDALPCTDI